jgi:hypothetical protein
MLKYTIVNYVGTLGKFVGWALRGPGPASSLEVPRVAQA